MRQLRRRCLASLVGCGLLSACQGGGDPGADEPGVVHAPPPSRGPVRLAAGESDTCAWSQAYEIACWGGFTGPRVEFVPPAGLPIDELVVSGNTRCTRSKGFVTCWGHARRSIIEPLQGGFTDLVFDPSAHQKLCGARGSEVVCWSMIDGSKDAPTPVVVAVDAVAVSAAAHGVCALGRDGRVRCWQQQCKAPVEVAGLDDAVAIAGPCAARRDGPTVCWPIEWCASDSAVPVSRELVGRGVHTALAAGPHQACGRTREGNLECWELPQDAALAPRRAQTIEGLEGVESFAVGEHHACASRRDGTTACWGDNRWAQLGEPHNVPYLATPTPLLADAKELGISRVGGCVVRADDRVWCWGGRDDGWDEEPRPLPGIWDAHGLVVTDVGGCVRRRNAAPTCWLDIGPPPKVMPWPDRPKRPISKLRLHDVAVIGCALYGDATAECVMGPGASASRRKFRKVRDVAFCDKALCIIASDGAVSCIDRLSGDSVPFPIAAVEADAELRCREGLACVVKPGAPTRCRKYGRPLLKVSDEDPPFLVDGVLRGSERAAALSWSAWLYCLRTDADAVECSESASEPATVPSLRGVVQVEVGSHHACAQQYDGVVACWGGNNRAAAGVGSSARQERPVPVLLPDAVTSPFPRE